MKAKKNTILKFLGMFILLGSVLTITQCKKKEDPTPEPKVEEPVKSSKKEVTLFVVGTDTAEIDNQAFTTTLILPAGTDLTKITPVIKISNKATITEMGEADFTNSKTTPIKFTITAEDGSKQEWKAIILEGKSPLKTILTFSVPNQTEVAIIDKANFTVTLVLPSGADLTKITPTITISAKATISTITEQNFTNSGTTPIKYTVTAEDGSKQEWKISILEGKSPLKQLLTFSVPNQNSMTIDKVNFTITGEIPATSDLTKIIPTITISENATISPEGEQNFTNTLNYTVTAEDGTEQIWAVTITKAASLGNTMLSNPSTGDISSKKVNDFTLADNGTDVVLIFADNTAKKIYAIDVNDNNANDATANTISADISTLQADIATKLGWTNAYLTNMEVNPISKAVYVLSSDGSNNTAMVKLTNAGATITVLDLSNIDYVEMGVFSTALAVSDMTFGDRKLFLTSNTFNDNEVSFVTSPFSNSSGSTNQKTAMFKSNWAAPGNQKYETTASLDYICYGETSNGSKRIMGLTQCCPGYSLPLTDLTGANTLNVTEYFYLPGGLPEKVVSVSTGGKTYMFTLYEQMIQRIGEKYLDGSITNPSELNENRKAMFAGTWSITARASGLTDSDMKEYKAAKYKMLCSYSSTHLLVLDDTDKLSLLAI